nr:hypothetical protein [Streptomyces antibioticus]
MRPLDWFTWTVVTGPVRPLSGCSQGVDGPGRDGPRSHFATTWFVLVATACSTRLG